MSAPLRHVVTAVVVSHNGERWLRELVAGVRQQRRPADRVVVVDTGSTDESTQILGRAFSPRAILTMPPRTGFGAAVRHAVSALPADLTRPGPADPRGEGDPRGQGVRTVEWLWLLHDDCAPTPGALHELLALVDEVPGAAVLGPKLRSWPRGRGMLELGVTISGSGARETGLEEAEFDQGQHDIVRETLAVGSAGMLVRRDVFEEVGGFDPRLPLFRDDVDFGWRVHRAGYHVITCPDAIVYHAEAGSRGHRRLDAVRHVRPRRADRAAAIYTLLANCAWYSLPFVGLRMLLGSLLRTIGLLIAKWPDAAYDEFTALASTFARPDRVLRGRLRRTRGRRVSRRKLRHLFPPPWIGIQHTADALTAVLSRKVELGTHASPRKGHRIVESGPVSEEAEALEDTGPGRVRQVLGRPPVLLVLGFVVLAVIASRHVLTGGALAGGALLPAPDTAWDLWRRYAESWHPVSLGSARAAPPYLVVIAFLGTIFAGKIGIALTLLMLGSVPLAGLTGYLFTREVLRARPVRLWAAGVYALVPAITGAVSAGRLGTCAATILLPLVGIAAVRAVRSGSWSATWTTGLLLAIVASFVPMAYVGALALGIAAVGALRPRRRVASRVAVALVVPPVLLMPWLPALAADPSLLLGEAGLVTRGLNDPNLPAYAMAFGNPGGAGAAPFWLLGILGPVALVALLRRDRVSGVVSAWALAVTGVVLGLVQSRLLVAPEWASVGVPGWPGFAATFVIAGWVAALAYSADGVNQVFSRRSFSWRQPSAGLLAIVVVAAPVLAAGWWVVRGAAGPLERLEPALPDYIATAQTTGDRPRALVVRGDGRDTSSVGYAVLRGDGARLGDAETGSDIATLHGLDSTVAEMLGDSRTDNAARALASYGIGYVYLPAPADSRLVQRLDTTPGLARASAPDRAAAWTLEGVRPGPRIVPASARADVGAVPARTVRARTGTNLSVQVPSGAAGRLLVLPEAYDRGWRATLDGQALKAVEHDGWAQAFELPAGAGTLRVGHDGGLGSRLLILQAVLAGIVLVLALPTRARRKADLEDYGSEPGGRHGRTEEFAAFDAPAEQPAPVGAGARPAPGPAPGAPSGAGAPGAGSPSGAPNDPRAVRR